ncbi:hypothetical protein [Actinomycetospora soli]|uniref:hypothetical protein n=1 Tax=Actinomycetospora soli TaxID=2893887 RepID=UPI001E28ACD3|nr:hypothetical protein [Actinomycetospora soli]MCD2188645.1 hypothetical protein [Actinomycetospora soli]
MTDGRQPLSDRPRGTARGGVPDDEVRAAWSRWLGTLRTRGRDPSPVLRPGAAPSAIAAAEQAVGFALPDPVRAVYALTDGQADPAQVGGPTLFPARVFCPLRRAGELAGEREMVGRWPLGEGDDGLLLVGADGRVLGADDREIAADLVDYLGLLSVADLQDVGSAAGTTGWDVPDLR